MHKNHKLFKNSDFQKWIYRGLFISVLAILTGCNSFQNLTQDKKKAEMEQRKKNYQTLLQHASNKTLTKGLSTEEVRNTYGEPDDLYRAGSNLGSTEVWTYGKGKDYASPDDWHPVRLYFDSNHLIDWNF